MHLSILLQQIDTINDASAMPQTSVPVSVNNVPVRQRTEKAVSGSAIHTSLITLR